MEHEAGPDGSDREPTDGGYREPTDGGYREQTDDSDIELTDGSDRDLTDGGDRVVANGGHSESTDGCDRGLTSGSGLELTHSAIRKDIVVFGLPALVVFFLGLVISGRDGYDGLLGVLWGLLRDPASYRGLSMWNVAGLALFVVGLALALASVATLKTQYSSSLVIRRSHRLVTHGPYRLVRHPVYLGVLIAVMGPAVYASSLYGSLTMLLLVPIFLLRIRLEEAMLADRFGTDYDAYRQRTRKLVPFLY